MLKQQQGLTLIELMLTVSILGVLVTVGLPSMSQLIQSSQLTSTTNELLGDIQRARVAALRNASVQTFEISNTCVSTEEDNIPTLCNQGFSQTSASYLPLTRLQFGPQGQLLFIKNDPPPFGYIAIKHTKLDRARCIRLLPTGNAAVTDCPADITIGEV